MILTLTIVLLFWVLIPGVVAGWVMRSFGRNFRQGFLLGAAFGPFGLVAATVSVLSRRGGVAVGRLARGNSRTPPRPARPFFHLPVIGPVHPSTGWTLAGLTTFLSFWALGGLAFETYRTPAGPQEEDGTASTRARANISPSGGPNGPAANAPAPKALQTDSGLAADGRRRAESAQEPLMGGLAPHYAPRVPSAANTSSGAPAEPEVPAAATAETFTLEPRTFQQQSQTEPRRPETSDAPPARSGPSRDAVVAELTNALNSRGFRVHATLSGDAQTRTLTLSSASLNRGAGNQLLGNRRMREELKAAGVRVVVMINGQESWSYIL